VGAVPAPGGTAALTFPGWWSDAGTTGWTPDGSFAHGLPWTFAGLVAGGWELRDPFTQPALPGPGVAEAQAPLAWYDSASVTLGRDGAWTGYGAGLAIAEGTLRSPAGGKPRAVLTIVSGDHSIDRNAISVSHGDADTWLRGGAVGDRRGGIGDLDLAGDHLWTVTGGTRRGAHRFEAAFAQRGMGESQRWTGLGGVGESAAGQGGRVGWGWLVARESLAVRYARAFDHRDRFLTQTLGTVTTREADGRSLEFEWRHATPGGSPWGARLEFREGRVQRWFAPPAPPARQDWSERSGWFAVRTSRALGGGTLDLQLGGGRDRSLGHAVAAPGASWTVTRSDRMLRVFGERTLVPVWSDLVATSAFTQDTWAGGLEAEAGRGHAFGGQLQAIGGRAASRGTLLRYPIRDVSLQLGWLRDPRPYRFLLMQGALSGRAGALDADAGGFALARERSTSQTQVDPALGARAGIGCRLALFSGDLGVRARLEGVYVGSRETDTQLSGADVVLPGYSTLTARIALTLGDATIVIRGDGLGGTRHPESWIDPSQAGDVLARDAGPLWRTEVTWPLFN
jgi:hypothetical protein